MTYPTKATPGNDQDNSIACYFDATKLDADDIALMLEMLKEEHASIRAFFNDGGGDDILLNGLDEAEEAVARIERKCIFTIS